MRIPFTIISLLALVLCAGCGTVVNHVFTGGGCMSLKGLDGVYRGVRSDGALIISPFTIVADPTLRTNAPVGLYFALPVFVVGGIVDLPFSLAADTLVLPCDLAKIAAEKKEKKQ